MFFSQEIYLNDGLLAQATYYEDQGRVKSQTRTSDYVYFSTLENRIRNKYKDLNIPQIIVAQSVDLVLTGEHLDPGCCYFCEVNYIVLRGDTISNLSSVEVEWIILHEAGHAQKQVENKVIGGLLLAVPLIVAYYWGMHKTEPYKNSVSKLLSKAFAGMTAGIIVGSELIKAEERRADSWANEHADKTALLGGIDALKYCKGVIEDKLSRKDSALLSKIPFCILEWLCCPYHPSIDSRITKIKKSLKKRFEIDVTS